MNELVIGDIYKHFKEHVYKLIAVARDAEDLSEKIVYQNTESGEMWVRDKAEFWSKIDKEKYPLVNQEFRFELVRNE